MKLADFQTFIVNDGYRNFVLLRLRAEDGSVGLGEATVEWNELAVEAELRQLCPRLVGKDLRRIEAIWEELYRETYWLGSLVIMSGISAIDQALWDLKAKSLGVPVYELLGGRTHPRLRAYANGWYWGCHTPEEFARQALRVVARGYTALKWDPFGDAALSLREDQARGVVENVAAVREAVGPDVDLLIEVHGRLAPSWAVDILKRLAPFRPFLVEEPVPPDDLPALRHVARYVDLPLAAGERYTSRYVFRELLEMGAVATIQPDVCHVGGITELKKIAALADSRHVMVAPHNASGPVGTAATVQVDATLNNFLIQEFFVTQPSWFETVFPGAPRVVDGFLTVPEAPGLGIDLDADEALRHPFREYWDGKNLYTADWQGGLPRPADAGTDS
jgi:galactonate dehydratase